MEILTFIKKHLLTIILFIGIFFSIGLTQKLSDRIYELENQVLELEDKNTDLESRVDELEYAIEQLNIYGY